MAKKVHWSKTKAGRKRLSEIHTLNWAKRKAAPTPSTTTHGHHHEAAASSEIPIRRYARTNTLVKESIRALAIEGARVKLADLDRQREVLQMFIKSGDKK